MTYIYTCVRIYVRFLYVGWLAAGGTTANNNINPVSSSTLIDVESGTAQAAVTFSAAPPAPTSHGSPTSQSKTVSSAHDSPSSSANNTTLVQVNT